MSIILYKKQSSSKYTDNNANYNIHMTLFTKYYTGPAKSYRFILQNWVFDNISHQVLHESHYVIHYWLTYLTKYYTGSTK